MAQSHAHALRWRPSTPELAGYQEHAAALRAQRWAADALVGYPGPAGWTPPRPRRPPRGGQHCWSAGLLISLPVRLACLIISTACLFATPVGQYASAHLGWWCYGELLRARTPPAHAHCLFGPPRPMPYTIASHRLAHTSTIPALHCFHFLGFISGVAACNHCICPVPPCPCR